MKKRKYVVDTGPLIDLLLIICCNIKEENIAKDECKKHEKYFSQIGEEEREMVWKKIYALIITKDIIVTPHILAETYDLLETRYNIKGKIQEPFWASVMDFLEKIREECVRKEDIINEKMFMKYGFADTSVYLAAKKLKNENKEFELVLVTGEDKDAGKLKSLSKKDGFSVTGFEEIFWKWTDVY